MVHEAIGKALEEAKQKSHDLFIGMTLASENETVRLDSLYQLRVFQFVPILEELDRREAEDLLQENIALKPTFTRYLKGWFSFTEDLGAVTMASFTDYRISSGSEPALIGADIELSRRFDDLAKEAEENPARALSDALTFPLTDGVVSARADALLHIAEITAGKKTEYGQVGA